MFFVLAKIIGFVIKPLNVLLILLAAVIGFGHLKDRVRRQRRRLMRRCYRVSSILLMIWIANLVMPIIPYMTVHGLEHRFPQPEMDALDADVIIILGGWQGSPNAMRDATTPSISSSGDRLITGLILAQRFPDAVVALPGGLKRGGTVSEADISQAVIDGLGYNTRGLGEDRFIIEGLSRNTSENAVFLKEMLRKRGIYDDGQIVLITSAWHMPRAMGSFRAAGINPIAYPTDYMTPKGGMRFGGLFLKGLGLTHTALSEVIGLIAYRVTGRTDRLFPAS